MGFMQDRQKATDAFESTHIYWQPHTHQRRSRGIEFQRADYHMVYYCMLEEASVPLSSAEQMWAENSMRQRNTLFGCMMSSYTFKCLYCTNFGRASFQHSVLQPPYPPCPPHFLSNFLWICNLKLLQWCTDLKRETCLCFWIIQLRSQRKANQSTEPRVHA